jgi:hypothetical protein
MKQVNQNDGADDCSQCSVPLHVRPASLWVLKLVECTAAVETTRILASLNPPIPTDCCMYKAVSQPGMSCRCTGLGAR